MSLASSKAFFKSLQGVTVKDAPVSGSGKSEIIVIAINNKGTRLVNSRTDRTLRIWKCGSDKLVDPLVIERPHTKSVVSISWNPVQEHIFATVGRDNMVKIWRSGGALDRAIKVTRNKSSESEISCHSVSYSADGRILAVAAKDNMIHFFDVNSNYSKIAEFETNEYIYDIHWFNHEHTFLICALHDGSAPLIKLTDIDNGGIEVNLRTRLMGHRSFISCVDVDPNGQYFVLGSNEGVASIWNTSSMLNSNVVSDADEPIAHVSTSSDGSYLALAFDSNSMIRIYEVDSSSLIYEVPNSTSSRLLPSTIAWLPSKTAFVYSSDNSRTMTLMKKN